MRRILLLLGLAACGTADAGSQDSMFEIRRVEVGHPTASVLALDLDGDRWLDLVVSGGDSVTVLRGTGSGDFQVAEVVAAGEHPVDLEAGDLDGDGHLDLVVANHETTYLTLLFGGDGGFRSGRSARLPVHVSPHPHAVALADIDEDGALDIVVDDRDRHRLNVYGGRGDGSFDPRPPIPVGGDPYRGMTITDLDGDGHLDVITPNPRSVVVQYGDGSGAFSVGPRLESGSVPPFNTAVGDFNGDGFPDIAAGSGEGAGGLAVWFGSSGGSMEMDAAAPYRIADGPTRLGTADVDGDGYDDVLVTSYLGNEIAIAFGSRQDLRVVRVALDDYPWDVAAADLDGDGRMDLVTANDGGNRIAVLLARDD